MPADATTRYGCGDLGTRRVDHAQHAEKDQLQFRRLQVAGCRSLTVGSDRRAAETPRPGLAFPSRRVFRWRLRCAVAERRPSVLVRRRPRHIGTHDRMLSTAPFVKAITLSLQFDDRSQGRLHRLVGLRRSTDDRCDASSSSVFDRNQKALRPHAETASANDLCEVPSERRRQPAPLRSDHRRPKPLLIDDPIRVRRRCTSSLPSAAVPARNCWRLAAGVLRSLPKLRLPPWPGLSAMPRSSRADHPPRRAR